MTKLTRKLLLSIMAVAFAFITLGATTFAWFTLTTTANVDTFEAEMITGTGIEMSLDGVNYKNYFTTEEIISAITGLPADGKIVFDLVTSADGIKMVTLGEVSPDQYDPEDDSVADATTGTYIRFYAWFRSPTEGARIYLLSDTKTSSPGKSWQADAKFEYGYYTPEKFMENEITSGTQAFDVYLADALRMSFQKYTIADVAGKTFADPSETENVTIFELNPSITDRTLNESNPQNRRLDTKIVTNTGMVPYYNFKNTSNQLVDTFMATVPLPETVYDNTYLVNNLEQVTPEYPELITLTAQKTGDYFDGYYYGYVMIRMWMEGWDPDAFNSLLGDSLTIDLSFGGADPVVEEETGD